VANVIPYLGYETLHDGRTSVTTRLVFEDVEAAERFHNAIIAAVKHELDAARDEPTKQTEHLGGSDGPSDLDRTK
jgi:hypothetical protein